MVPLSVVPKPFRSFLLRKLRGSAATPGLEGTVGRAPDLQSGRNAFCGVRGQLLRGAGFLQAVGDGAVLEPPLADRHPAWPWPARSAQQGPAREGRDCRPAELGTVAIMLIGVKSVTGSNGSLG